MPLRKSERSTTLKIKLIANKAITGLTCPNCHESKVALSRTKSSDIFQMLLLPKRPYRCVLCYQRFWFSESFFSHRGRAVVWLCLMLGLGGSLFWLLGSDNSGQSQAIAQSESPPNVAIGVKEPAPEEPLVKAKDVLDQSAQTLSTESSDETPLHDVFADSGDINVQEVDISQLNGGAQTPQSRAEWRRQLAQAKQNSEAAESAINERQKVLSEALDPNLDELKSLAKVEINYQIEQWRQAWARGLVDQYLSFYSDRFSPDNGVSLSTWRAQRRSRVNPDRGIIVELRNFDVSFDPGLGRATVVLEQDYRAGTYQDVVQKQLVLSKEELEWKIVLEQQLTP